MAKHITNKDRSSSWNVTSDNDTWIVGKDASFKIKNDCGVDDNYHANTTVKVEGEIKVIGPGYTAVVLNGDDNTLIIGKDAHIDASKASGAVQGNGQNPHIVNNGLIEAGFCALIANNGGSMINTGDLLGRNGMTMYFQMGDEAILKNNGVIDVQERGIVALATSGQLSQVFNGKHAEIHAVAEGVSFENGGDGKFVNGGIVEATIAVKDNGGEVTLVNRGKLIGDIDLGAGDDVLDLRKGTLEGKAYGGDGADLYIISSAKTQMAEGLFGGHDTVQSSVKFQLSNFFEDLQLIGSNNISGRGNVIGNHVTGNTGDNRLFGYEGQDVLSGGAGNDLLSGGADGDVFVFKTGFGEDVISDFENGIDKIDLSGWETIANYSDLVLGHLAVDGADLVFTSGDEILRLKNVDISALDSSDFVS